MVRHDMSPWFSLYKKMIIFNKKLMNKYNSLGALLIDYRRINRQSQSDFAARLNVDIRTVQRWEKNKTLINQEKEEELVFEPLLPYQLIRNLNAAVTIPTYFDFEIQKYSLSKISSKLPEALWFRNQMDVTTKRIRKIDFKFDIDYIMRSLELKNNKSNAINKNVLLKAIEMLPELNLIITDDSGYYSGHMIIFSITVSAFKKLKNREISKNDLTISDIVNYKSQEQSIFMGYDTSADCNDNYYYLISPFLNFFNSISSEGYIFCSVADRTDYFELLKETGIEMIWEDTKNVKFPIRFYEGNFNDFFMQV